MASTKYCKSYRCGEVRRYNGQAVKIIHGTKLTAVVELKTNSTYRYDSCDSHHSLAIAEAILNSNKFALAARAFYCYIKYLMISCRY